MAHVFKLSSLALTLGVVCASAAQADVVVRIDGRSPAEIRAAVYDAAVQVCREDDYSPLAAQYLNACVAGTVDETLVKIADIKRVVTLSLAKSAPKGTASR